jgi:hypothetical protein
MNSIETAAADLYQNMDALTLQDAELLGLPTEVKAFACEVAADIVELTPEQVLIAAMELDDKTENDEVAAYRIGSSSSLSSRYTKALALIRGTDELKEAAADRFLRICLARRTFKLTYPERFPERNKDKFISEEPFQNGAMLAAKLTGSYLATH